MTTAVLETKLYVPRRRRGLVARPRLTERLARADEATLTLVSAPAGFGKTTAVADWLADAVADGRAGAWLSLDAADSQPPVFWAGVFAAVDRAAPGIGEPPARLLAEPGTTIESALGALVDGLEAAAADVILVLDDYHLVEDRAIHEAVVYLLEHAPERLHLVLITRADPPLPLARLRAHGRLVEIRAADLRFTPDEAATYLHDSMGLVVPTSDVATLEARTEGWIAALQLAALSLQGRDDVHDFITGFAGDDRYVVDYLVEEVLRRQPDDVRSFLLETSILARMTGAAADAVTGRTDGRATLEALDRANLFLVPLDDRRRWYRYHHLFADVLQTHLLEERPDDVPGLHGRASAWFEREGEVQEAIRHAVAAGDMARAASLIELAIPAMRRDRQEGTIRHWIEALPPAVRRERPILGIGYVGALMASGMFGEAERPLEAIEAWLASPSPDAVVEDDAELRRLPGQVAMYRAALARIHGDVQGTIVHARRVFELVAEDDHLGRGGAAALIGLSHWSLGDLDAAADWYAEAIARLERAGHLSDVLGCTLAAADIQLAKGRLSEAARILERGAALAAGAPGAPLRGASDMHVGLAEILRERGDVAGAREHLRRADALGDAAGLPQDPYRRRVALALVIWSEGDLGRAVALLDEAERVYDGDFSPDVRPIAAVRARAWIAAGLLGDAWSWARERGLSPDDDLTYLREFEHTTLAMLIVAHASHDDDRARLEGARQLTDRLLVAAEEGGRSRSAIEILVVGALARDALGDRPGALAGTRRAVVLAESEGYVRAILDAGPSIEPLLARVATAGEGSGYAARLLGGNVAAPARRPTATTLVEPLSDRELEVLRLLRGDLDGPDIARALHVSLNTLRTHTKNIYAKLGVNSRRAAVRRAVELDLLPR